MILIAESLSGFCLLFSGTQKWCSYRARGGQTVPGNPFSAHGMFAAFMPELSSAGNGLNNAQKTFSL